MSDVYGFPEYDPDSACTRKVELTRHVAHACPSQYSSVVHVEHDVVVAAPPALNDPEGHDAQADPSQNSLAAQSHVLDATHSGTHPMSSAAADPVANPPRVTSASHQLDAHEPGVSLPVSEHVASNASNPNPQVGVHVSPGARLAVQSPTSPPRPPPAGGADASHERAYTPAPAKRTRPSPETAA